MADDPQPVSLISKEQNSLIAKAKAMLEECGFDGIVILVSGTAYNEKKKLSTFKEAFFCGNTLVHQKLLEVFAEKLNDSDSGSDKADDDDDGESWKHNIA
jgi:hypothetical protein